MRLSLILSAVDRMSRPVREGFRGLSDRVRQARERIRDLRRDTDRGGSALRRFARFALNAAHGGLEALRRRAIAARAAIGPLLRNLAMTGLRTAGMGLAAAGGLFGFGLGIFARGVISNAAKFEQYQVALEGTEGSAKKAAAAMRWVQKFAKDTPYDIDTVTEAFVRARGVGIDPLTGAFRILGDAAGGTGKALMDAVEAMADAQTGEFERLKEFGITTSSKGETATFDYIDKAGKKVSVSVKKSMAEISAAILDVFDKKYGGGMERQSKTLIGIWSNLQDVVTNFELKVADAGIFDRVKSKLQAVLEWTNRLQEEGKLDAWAKQASNELTRLWDAAERFITQTDWRSVADGIGAIVTVVTTLTGLLGRAVQLYQRLSDIAQRYSPNMAPGLSFLPTYMRPIANIGWNWATGSGQQPAPPTASRPQAAPPARQQYERLDPKRSEMWNRVLRTAPAAAQPGKLSVDINLRGSGARDASVGPLKADGPVRANVNRGYAMGGPA